MADKKKLYSKNGCRECKRRKIKCDETKPQCIQCTRLDKVCSYPKAGEKVLRVSKKFMIENGETLFGSEENEQIENIKLNNKRKAKQDNQTKKISKPNNQSPTSSNTSNLSYSPATVSQDTSSMKIQNQVAPQLSNYSLIYQQQPQQPLPTAQQQQIPQLPQPPRSQSQHAQPPQYYNYQVQNRISIPNPLSNSMNHLPLNLTRNSSSSPIPGQPISSSLGHSNFNYNVPPPFFKPFQPLTQSISSDLGQINPSSQSVSRPQSTNQFQFQSISHPQGKNHLQPPNVNIPGPNSIPLTPGIPFSYNSGHSPAPVSDIQGSTNNTSPISKLSNSPNHHLTNNVINNNNNNSNNNIDIFDNYFNNEDLNILASDLNELVGTIMFESNFPIEDFDISSLDKNNISRQLSCCSGSSVKDDIILPPSIPIMQSMYSKNNDNYKILLKNIPLDYIRLNNPQEQCYLDEFYHDFAQVILPFNPYDESVGGYYNPARDILLTTASKEPLLLAAILAQGAKTAYSKSNLAKDEEAYCKYLSRCLRLLGPALNKRQGQTITSEKNLASNIEGVLLTVLLLTSANASNIKQDWRPHLKGAKDLLIKYASHSNDFKESKILIFCKTWFISFEVLAGLSSNKGGTLKNKELDLLMKLDDSLDIETLKEIGIVMENGFNYVFGFHHHMLPTIKDLIKFLNFTRDKEKNESFDTFQIINMLGSFNQFSKIHLINDKFYLNLQDFNNGSIPIGVCFDRQHLPHQNIKDENEANGNSMMKGDVIINWIDLTNQAYVLAGMLAIITKGFNLNYDSDQVKEVTEKLINLMKILKYLPNPQFIKWAPLYIQWPMLIGGLNCNSQDQKQIVENFFQIVGSGSASFSIKIINTLWHKRFNSNHSDDSDSDLEIDLVTY